MAHSIQSLGDEAAIIDDLDLLILIGMMIDEVNDRSSEYSSLRPFSENWHALRISAGPGTLDLCLETLVDDKTATSELIELLSAIAKQVKQYGEHIPAELANAKWATDGVRFYDYPTSRVASAIQTLNDLILNAATNDVTEAND